MAWFWRLTRSVFPVAEWVAGVWYGVLWRLERRWFFSGFED